MNDERVEFFLRAIGDARKVGAVLVEGYDLADAYLRLRQPGYASEMLRITAQSLRNLADKTAEIAVALTGQN